MTANSMGEWLDTIDAAKKTQIIAFSVLYLEQIDLSLSAKVELNFIGDYMRVEFA